MGAAGGPTSLDLDRAVLDAMASGTVPIPSYPAVALRIQEIVARPAFGLAEVSQTIGSDPTLAAGVLRCANSALYGRGSQVTALGPAIIRIGAAEVTRIALTSALAGQAQAPGPLALLRRRAWTESLAGSVLCRELARVRGLPVEDASVCGLLHDFGKVVVIACVESVLTRHRGTRPRSEEAWLALAERYHVEVGSSVASRWRLPSVIQEAIRLHHEPAAAGSGATGLLAVVRASDEVVALLGRSPGLDEAALTAVPALSPAERVAVAAAAEQIPSFVASFEDSRHAAIAASMVEAPAGPAIGTRKVTFGVLASVGGSARPFKGMAMSETTLWASGGERLPEGRLLEFSLECGPAPWSIWAFVERCRPEGAGYEVELRPFALSQGARARWNEVLARGPLAGPRSDALPP